MVHFEPCSWIPGFSFVLILNQQCAAGYLSISNSRHDPVCRPTLVWQKTEVLEGYLHHTLTSRPNPPPSIVKDQWNRIDNYVNVMNNIYNNQLQKMHQVRDITIAFFIATIISITYDIGRWLIFQIPAQPLVGGKFQDLLTMHSEHFHQVGSNTVLKWRTHVLTAGKRTDRANSNHNTKQLT